MTINWFPLWKCFELTSALIFVRNTTGSLQKSSGRGIVSPALHPTPPPPPPPTLLLLLPTGSQPSTQAVTSSATGRQERRQTNRPRAARVIQSRLLVQQIDTGEEKEEEEENETPVFASGLRVVGTLKDPPTRFQVLFFPTESRFHRWHNGLLQRAMHSHLYLHFTAGELTRTRLFVFWFIYLFFCLFVCFSQVVEKIVFFFFFNKFKIKKKNYFTIKYLL